MSSTLSACLECGTLNRVDLKVSAQKQPVCGSCQKPLPFEGMVQKVSGQSLGQLIRKSELPIVIDFWAPWCGPCRAFAPVFAEAAEKFLGRALFVKLNTEENSFAAQGYGIRGIPTLMYYANGLERDRVSGALSAEALTRWLESHLASASPEPTP